MLLRCLLFSLLLLVPSPLTFLHPRAHMLLSFPTKPTFSLIVLTFLCSYRSLLSSDSVTFLPRSDHGILSPLVFGHNFAVPRFPSRPIKICGIITLLLLCSLFAFDSTSSVFSRTGLVWLVCFSFSSRRSRLGRRGRLENEELGI